MEEGLIDEVGGIRDALNKLHEMIDEKMENTDKNYENDIRRRGCYNKIVCTSIHF